MFISFADLLIHAPVLPHTLHEDNTHTHTSEADTHDLETICRAVAFLERVLESREEGHAGRRQSSPTAATFNALIKAYREASRVRTCMVLHVFRALCADKTCFGAVP
jgi:hypothetical protein